MANTRDIRRRIKSVKNTSQITRAMQLVAASKMKKAQDQAIAGRPYADLMNKVLVNLKENDDGEVSHPLMEVREGDRELMLVVSTDKGLCGGLNTNLFKKVLAADTEHSSYVTVGRKGKVMLGKLNKTLLADFEISDPVAFAAAKQVSKFIIQKFLDGEVDRVKVSFTNFINTLSQEAHVETLLPVSPITLAQKKEYEGVGRKDDIQETDKASASYAGYIFEPDVAHVYDNILPLYIGYQVYQMILEARASEHSARMVAMKSATDNADELIKDLTLQYNKLRQAAITNELLEITTAMKALE